MVDAESLNNLIYVQFNAKLVDKQMTEKGQRDVLIAKEASKAQEWIVEGGKEEDEEIYLGLGLMWGMVGDATERMKSYMWSNGTVGATSSARKLGNLTRI